MLTPTQVEYQFAWKGQLDEGASPQGGKGTQGVAMTSDFRRRKEEYFFVRERW